MRRRHIFDEISKLFCHYIVRSNLFGQIRISLMPTKKNVRSFGLPLKTKKKCLNFVGLKMATFRLNFLKEVNCGIPEINIWLEKKEEIRGGVLKNHSCMWLLIFVHLVYLTL